MLLNKNNAVTTIKDLHTVGTRVSTLYNVDRQKDELLKGRFFFLNLENGLSSHGGSVLELENVKTVFELPAGISINLIFEGSIEFILNGQVFSLANHTPDTALGSVISVNRNEAITRQMKQGQRVSKLNLFVEKHWLDRRFSTSEVSYLLKDHASVKTWTPPAKAVRLAQELIALGADKKHGAHLQYEARVIELFSLWVETQHLPESGDRYVGSPARQGNGVATHLKQQVDRHLNSQHSLESIASELGISVSTLQRRFKMAFGITVIEYLRQRRLEKAKHGILHEGLSIGEAAYLAGYTYPSNFLNAFKKLYKMTPQEMLKKHR